MSDKKAPPESQIAEAAFHIWQNEGQPDGMAQEHWQRAKAQLEAREAFGAGQAAPAVEKPKRARKAVPAPEEAAPAPAAETAPKKRAPRKPKAAG